MNTSSLDVQFAVIVDKNGWSNLWEIGILRGAHYKTVRLSSKITVGRENVQMEQEFSTIRFYQEKKRASGHRMLPKIRNHAKHRSSKRRYLVASFYGHFFPRQGVQQNISDRFTQWSDYSTKKGLEKNVKVVGMLHLASIFSVQEICTHPVWSFLPW